MGTKKQQWRMDEGSQGLPKVKVGIHVGESAFRAVEVWVESNQSIRILRSFSVSREEALERLPRELSEAQEEWRESYGAISLGDLIVQHNLDPSSVRSLDVAQRLSDELSASESVSWDFVETRCAGLSYSSELVGIVKTSLVTSCSRLAGLFHGALREVDLDLLRIFRWCELVGQPSLGSGLTAVLVFEAQALNVGLFADGELQGLKHLSLLDAGAGMELLIGEIQSFFAEKFGQSAFCTSELSLISAAASHSHRRIDEQLRKKGYRVHSLLSLMEMTSGPIVSNEGRPLDRNFEIALAVALCKPWDGESRKSFNFFREESKRRLLKEVRERLRCRRSNRLTMGLCSLSLLLALGNGALELLTEKALKRHSRVSLERESRVWTEKEATVVRKRSEEYRGLIESSINLRHVLRQLGSVLPSEASLRSVDIAEKEIVVHGMMSRATAPSEYSHALGSVFSKAAISVKTDTGSYGAGTFRVEIKL